MNDYLAALPADRREAIDAVRAGKNLDMGKSCVRFKKLDDLALDVIGEAIRRVPAKTARSGRAAKAPGRR